MRSGQADAPRRRWWLGGASRLPAKRCHPLMIISKRHDHTYEDVTELQYTNRAVGIRGTGEDGYATGGVLVNRRECATTSCC